MNPKPKTQVFISRTVEKDSLLLKLLEAAGIELIGASLLEFDGLDFEYPAEADWLFFYSKNGIRFFMDKLSPQQRSQLKPIATIGTGTGAYLQEHYQMTANFTGNGLPQKCAEEFIKVAKGQKVAFLRAHQSKKSVQEILAGQIEVMDCIVYQNQPRSNIAPIHANVLVFTSPLNVKAYFSKHKLTKGQQIVCIGPTTAAELSAIGFSQFICSESPTEGSLAQEIIKITSNS